MDEFEALGTPPDEFSSMLAYEWQNSIDKKYPGEKQLEAHGKFEQLMEMYEAAFWPDTAGHDFFASESDDKLERPSGYGLVQ